MELWTYKIVYCSQCSLCIYFQHCTGHKLLNFDGALILNESSGQSKLIHTKKQNWKSCTCALIMPHVDCSISMPLRGP